VGPNPRLSERTNNFTNQHSYIPRQNAYGSKAADGGVVGLNTSSGAFLSNFDLYGLPSIFTTHFVTHTQNRNEIKFYEYGYDISDRVYSTCIAQRYGTVLLSAFEKLILRKNIIPGCKDVNLSSLYDQTGVFDFTQADFKNVKKRQQAI
jgi:hypothetical protein